MFECILTGTTFSGHPTRTTFGNTLRSILFMKFCASRANIPWDARYINVRVAGDDIFICLH